MDLEYWKYYYEHKQARDTYSLFAKFVSKYLKPKEKLLEIGCGDCIDAIYLKSLGLDVFVIDQYISEYSKCYIDNKIRYFEMDIDNISNIDLKFDHIYMRFLLHSITEKQQFDCLLKASYLLFSKGLLFAEYRSLKNELYNKGTLVNKEENIFIYEGHHRRFIDSMKLLQYLTSIGFGILYFCEDKNLSPYKGDNQTFARIVAQKVR